MAGHYHVDIPLEEGLSKLPFLHPQLSLNSEPTLISNSNSNSNQRPALSKLTQLITTPAQNLEPFTTPPPELHLRQNAGDCSNSIIAAVNSATVAASRSLQQANATAEQALSQASISASAAIQQVAATASMSIAAAMSSASSAAVEAALAMGNLQSSASAAVSSASASLVMVQVNASSIEVGPGYIQDIKVLKTNLTNAIGFGFQCYSFGSSSSGRCNCYNCSNNHNSLLDHCELTPFMAFNKA
jgi:hypothetical protein